MILKINYYNLLLVKIPDLNYLILPYFGKHVLHVIDIVIDAVYQARGSPADISLEEKHAKLLTKLLDACMDNANSKHKKTSALARELLNDWNTFWVVLEHPELPLTSK